MEDKHPPLQVGQIQFGSQMGDKLDGALREMLAARSLVEHRLQSEARQGIGAALTTLGIGS